MQILGKTNTLSFLWHSVVPLPFRPLKPDENILCTDNAALGLLLENDQIIDSLH